MKYFTMASTLALLIGFASPSPANEDLHRAWGIGYGAGYHAGACCGGGYGGTFGCCENPLPHYDYLWADYCAPRHHFGPGGRFAAGHGCQSAGCAAEPCCGGCCQPPGARLRQLFSWCRHGCEPICCEPEPCCNRGHGGPVGLTRLFSWCRNRCQPHCVEAETCHDDCGGGWFHLKRLFPWRNFGCAPEACCYGDHDSHGSTSAYPADQPNDSPTPGLPDLPDSELPWPPPTDDPVSPEMDSEA